MVYCLRTADRAPDTNTEGSPFLPDLQQKRRADERTRTADLLITSDPSGVAGVCTGLQIPHIQRGFLSLPCCVLHRIAFPVVSAWYQTVSGIRALALPRFLVVPSDPRRPKQAYHSPV